MTMTVTQWKTHVEKLEADLRELESAPQLAEAKSRVAQLESDLRAARTISTSWHTRTADLSAAMHRQCNVENQLRQARQDLRVASGEQLKLQLLQARYSLTQAERAANSAVMFVG
jgi:chromosome segregation ATPase